MALSNSDIEKIRGIIREEVSKSSSSFADRQALATIGQVSDKFNLLVGFFRKTPIPQQTATDLPSVIALLKAYGLSS